MAASPPPSSSESRRRPYSNDEPGPSTYDRSTSSSSSYRPSSSSRRSPSPTASNHSSSAATNYPPPRRNWESNDSSTSALPSRPTFDNKPPLARRFDRRGDRDRDPSGGTKPFYERDRDTWVAPGAAGGGGAREGPKGGRGGPNDDGWNNPRRRGGGGGGGGDRGRDTRDPRDSRDGGRGGPGGRAVYERDARGGDYSDRPPNRQPPPHLSESSSNLNSPSSSSNPNPGWQRRNNGDSDRSSSSSIPQHYVNHSNRPRNASGNTQPYSRAGAGGAGPSNYSRPPPPSSMVDPSLWRTSYNPPPPSDRYPSLEYDPPARPGQPSSGSAGESGSSGNVVGSERQGVEVGGASSSTSGVGAAPVSSSVGIYEGQKRDEEPEEGEELEEGEVQSEDGEEKESSTTVDPSSRAVKVEQMEEAEQGLSREEEENTPRPKTPPSLIQETKSDSTAVVSSSPRPSSPPAAVALPPPSTTISPSHPLLTPATTLPPKPQPESIPSEATPSSPPKPEPSIPTRIEVEASSSRLPSPPLPPSNPPTSLSLPTPSIPPPTSLPIAEPSPPTPSQPSSKAELYSQPPLPSPPPPSSSEKSSLASSSSDPAPTPTLNIPTIVFPTPSPVLAPAGPASIPTSETKVTPPSPVIPEPSPPSSKDRDVVMSSPLTPTVEVVKVPVEEPEVAMEVDESSSKVVEEEIESIADISMEIEPELPPEEEEEETVPALPLTEEEIADVVVSQVQSRVSFNPSTARLEEETITSLIHFNSLLCDPPSSRLPLTPVSMPNHSTPPLGPQEELELEPEPFLSLSPLPSRFRQTVEARIQTSLHQNSEKADRLRKEYRSINAEWSATCQRLDRLTEKRNAAKANAKNHQYGANGSGHLFTPSGASTPNGGGGGGASNEVFSTTNGNHSSYSVMNTPGASYTSNNPVPSFLEESSRSSRASRSRANIHDPNNLNGGYFADAVRSEAEFQSILASLEDADSRDPNLRAARTTAVVPDMILGDMERKEDGYDDENGKVEDPVEFYREAGFGELEGQVVADEWTKEEIEIFEKRFAGYPKQFGKISELLPHKSTPQCVLYYYRTKKTIDYRTIVAQRGGAGRRKGGRRAGKASRLLSNLNGQGKRPKRTPNDEVNGSGSATPKVNDDEDLTSAPATPAGGGGLEAGPVPGTKKKRARVVGGGGGGEQSTTSEEFGAQAKKPRVFDLSTEGTNGHHGRQSNGTPSRGHGNGGGALQLVDASTASSSSNNNNHPLDPSSQHPSGDMSTPAPKPKPASKPRRKKPSLVPPPNDPSSTSTSHDLPFPDLIDPNHQHPDDDHPATKESNHSKRKKSLFSSYWSAAEKAAFMNGLSQFGKEWALVSQSMGGGKTAIQVKNYFQTNAEALGLEEIAEAATGDLVALLNGLEEDGISSADPASHYDQPQAALFESLSHSLLGYQPPPQSHPQSSRPISPLPPMDLGRPRSAMNIHDLLNSPDKAPPPSASATSRPPLWQMGAGSDYDRERERNFQEGRRGSRDEAPGPFQREREEAAASASSNQPRGEGEDRGPAPPPASNGDPYRGGGGPPRWGAAPSPLGYPDDPRAALEQRRPSYEHDPRSGNYPPPPPPPHHYPHPPPSEHQRGTPYPNYAGPASHPPPSSQQHPYGDYQQQHNLPLPSRPSYAASPDGNWPPPPSGHYHRPQQQPSGEHEYPQPPSNYQPQQQHYARYESERGGEPQGPYGGASPLQQEYHRGGGGGYPEGPYGREGERERGPPPPGGSWGPPGGGQQQQWRDDGQGGQRRVS
ncbi:hypothetical protein BDY24DRAFT_167718 [Mrakia frigida]|uniref:uncharacterized protein n=1 Tax=Mrakia frigida TaxID=29902 RepID=UPI003FCC00C6